MFCRRQLDETMTLLRIANQRASEEQGAAISAQTRSMQLINHLAAKTKESEELRHQLEAKTREVDLKVRELEAAYWRNEVMDSEIQLVSKELEDKKRENERLKNVIVHFGVPLRGTTPMTPPSTPLTTTTPLTTPSTPGYYCYL